MSKFNELWVCGHTRKCGWKGRFYDLKSKPDPMSERVGIPVTKSVCPKCDGDSFYIRTKPITSEELMADSDRIAAADRAALKS